MLDFCGAHDITADVEVIPTQKVDEEEASLEGVRPAGEPLDSEGRERHGPDVEITIR